MKAVFSTTPDDQYLFFVPIAAWSWWMTGVKSIVFTAEDPCYDPIYEQKFELIKNNTPKGTSFHPIWQTPDRLATYAQCSRLYAGALPGLDDDEVLVTTDVDMAIFGRPFESFKDGGIHILGHDLVPARQFPMCYVAMPVHAWKKVMQIGDKTYQDCLYDLLWPIQCDHMRGNYWGKDQGTVEEAIVASHIPYTTWPRAKWGTQFAENRLDRDGWDVANVDFKTLIDAHLPRPGYTEENFAKILQLFETMYPDQSFGWLIDYRNEYIKLIS